MTTDLRQFVGNPEVYAGQNADGSYTPIRQPITDDELARHQAGQDTLGTYVVWYDKARMFVFDIDDHDLGMAKDLAATCEKYGFHPGIEFSGRKGFHVWVLLDQWMLGSEVQQVAKAIAREVGFNGEVFPKQAAVRDLGSLIKLPMGVHAVTGNPSRFLSEPQVDTGVTFAKALGTLPAPPARVVKGGGPLPCLDSIQENPPGEGERNNLYFHFACHLRRMGLHEEAVEAVLREMWTDPDPGELETVVMNSEFSGPTCDSVPDARHCGEACIKNRARGLSVRPGQLRNAQEGEMLVVKAGPGVAGSNIRNIIHPDAEAGVVNLRKRDK